MVVILNYGNNTDPKDLPHLAAYAYIMGFGSTLLVGQVFDFETATTFFALAEDPDL